MPPIPRILPALGLSDLVYLIPGSTFAFRNVDYVRRREFTISPAVWRVQPVVVVNNCEKIRKETLIHIREIAVSPRFVFNAQSCISTTKLVRERLRC